MVAVLWGFWHYHFCDSDICFRPVHVRKTLEELHRALVISLQRRSVRSYLASVNIILLLTKCDVLEMKLKNGNKALRYVPSYGPRPNDPQDVINFFAANFTAEFKKANQNNNNSPRSLTVFRSSVEDLRTIRRLVHTLAQAENTIHNTGAPRFANTGLGPHVSILLSSCTDSYQREPYAWWRPQPCRIEVGHESHPFCLARRPFHHENTMKPRTLNHPALLTDGQQDVIYTALLKILEVRSLQVLALSRGAVSYQSLYRHQRVASG